MRTRGVASQKLYTEDELKKHKKGKEYVARELAKQESLTEYTQLNPEVPRHLNYFAKQEWEKITPLLMELPIAQHDLNLVENWCLLYSQRRKLQREIDTMGEVIYVKDDEGNIKSMKKNPAFDMIHSVIREQRMLASQLGLTISSRLELSTGSDEVEEDEFMKLLKGG